MVSKQPSFHEVDGVRYDRVTSALSIIAKPYLYAWYGKHGSEKCKEIVDASLDYGSFVHNLLERHIKGEDITKEIPIEKKRIFDDFFRISSLHRLTYVSSEMPVYNKKLLYCGTLDATAQAPSGQLWLVDFKTSKSIYPEYLLQLSAYWNAYEETTNQKIDKAMIIRLEKDNPDENPSEACFLDRSESEELFPVFESVLNVYRWSRKKAR